MITGGASGLGRCLAEIYALRGSTVAVIDIQDAEGSNHIENVRYYQCDVGDMSAVANTWGQITEEVRN